MGLLRENYEAGPTSFGILSGVFLGVSEEKISLPGLEELYVLAEGNIPLTPEERETFAILTFDFGDHPVTGEIIVGRVAMQGELGVGYLGTRIYEGRDPNPGNVAPGQVGGALYKATSRKDTLEILEIGRQYGIELPLDKDCSKVPEDFRRLCPAFNVVNGDLFASNRALVAWIRGGEISEGVGLIHQINIPLPWVFPG